MFFEQRKQSITIIYQNQKVWYLIVNSEKMLRYKFYFISSKTCGSTNINETNLIVSEIKQ